MIAFVSAVFAEERRQTSALIDETLSRVRGSAPRSGVMLTLEGHTRGTPSGPSRLLPSPGSILGSLQPSAASVAPHEASWRAWITRRAAIAGGLAGALVLLVVVLVAALGGGEAPALVSEPAPSRGVAAPIPLELSDLPVAMEIPELDIDRHATPSARWIAPRSAVHGSTHASTAASSAAELQSAPPAASTPPPRAEIGPGGGHAPLRPIITSNPYGTP